MSKAAIARTLGLNWQTVRQYLTYTTPPQRSSTVRHASVLMPYQPYVLGRRASGCNNARQLWREIAAQGFSGGYRTVARLTGSLRRQERLGAALPTAPVGMTPGQAAGLALVRPEHRGPREEEALAQLGRLHPQLHGTQALVSSFAARVRSPPGTLDAAGQLREWITQAQMSGIPELHGFAAKLRHDLDAVVSALALPYSQGQTEGFITKLKLLKRGMYGRAKLDLLRARVLYAAR